MAKRKDLTIEISLTGNFKDINIDPAKGKLTVTTQSLNDVNVTVIMAGQEKAMKLVPVEEQTNAPGVISSSPTAGAFNPANAVVKVGQVQLNKVSKYLSDLPDTAKAELLVAPKDTAKIFDRDIGTFNEDTASIRSINESHGIHHAGQAPKGMDIADRPSSAKDVTYEEAWAKEVRKAWKQANESGEDVTTGLAIGTKQIVHGREIGTRDVTVANNLYSNVVDINAALKAQGGQEIITSFDPGDAHWQFTASEHPDDRSSVYSVDFTDGDDDWDYKDFVRSSSRPIALQVFADAAGGEDHIVKKNKKQPIEKKGKERTLNNNNDVLGMVA